MSNIRKIALNVAVMASTFGFTTNSLAANIVLDPSFELINSGHWSLTNFGLSFGAHTGTYGASSGCVGLPCTSMINSGSFIHQVLNTVAGQSYDLSFWVGESAGPTSAFSVFWDGNLVASVTNPSNNIPLTPIDWLQFSYSGLVATGGATVLQVHGRHDPGTIYFDDFVVDVSAGNGAVPEPTTWALMLAGFGLMGGALRRRQKVALRYAM